MRVKLTMASAAEADEVKVAPEGAIEFKPLFFGKGRECTLFFLKATKEDGTVLFSGNIKVCGRTGAISIVDRTKPVEAMVDRPVVEKKKVASTTAQAK